MCSALCSLGGSRREKQKRRQSHRTEAACVGSACHNNLLTVYQISTAPGRVAPGTMYEPSAWQQTAAWKGTGGSGERLPKGRLMSTRCGSRREKQKRREGEGGEEEEYEEEATKTDPYRAEGGCAASAYLKNLLTAQQMRSGRSCWYRVRPVTSTARRR